MAMNGRSDDDLIGQALDELAARTTEVEIPEHLSASDAATLAPEVWEKAYGLPAKPARDRLPRFRRLWDEIFGRDLAVVAHGPIVRPDYFAQHPASHNGGAVTPSWGRYHSSLNWSGGHLTPKYGRAFSGCWGEWRVPRVALPANGAAGRRYRCSTWIGFDGQRNYLHSSLPQIGTEQSLDAAGNPAPPSAWVQWWQRGSLHPAITLSGMPVAVGDHMVAGIWTDNRSQATLYLVNLTQSVLMQPLRMTAPSVNGQPLRVSAATAEWITEKPSIWPTDAMYELPDFGTVGFTGFAVVAQPGDPACRELDFAGARLTDMREIWRNPDRRVDVSLARKKNAAEVTTTYRTN